MYFKEISLDSPKLFVLFIGGSMPQSQIEMHDTAFIVAQNDREITEKLRSRWFGTEKSLHIDSWLTVEELDGYEIKLSKTEPSQNSPNLYFVNLGYYKQGVFGESHFMTLVIATSKLDAIEKAKQKCARDLEELHSDNVYDLDDCIRIDVVDQYYIDLQATTRPTKPLIPLNGYQKLRSLETLGKMN